MTLIHELPSTETPKKSRFADLTTPCMPEEGYEVFSMEEWMKMDEANQLAAREQEAAEDAALLAPAPRRRLLGRRSIVAIQS